jgi:hypothetical protein
MARLGAIVAAIVGINGFALANCRIEDGRIGLAPDRS